MVEYFMRTANPPVDQGNLYDWMEVRAQIVKTNQLQLIPDNDGANPYAIGLPGSRMLFIKYRCEDNPGQQLICMVPGNESGAYNPMLLTSQGGSITPYSSSSNGNRIQPLTDTQQNMQYLAFKTIQPTTTMVSYLTINIDFNYSKVNQTSLPAGSVLMFNVQLFRARHPDFSDEEPDLGGLQSDRFNLILNAPDPTDTITPTNKQVCRFTTTCSYLPPDQTTTYFRFKISRSTSTSDATKMLLDQITLTAVLFDEST